MYILNIYIYIYIYICMYVYWLPRAELLLSTPVCRGARRIRVTVGVAVRNIYYIAYT
jgi:hypothetical protein